MRLLGWLQATFLAQLSLVPATSVRAQAGPCDSVLIQQTEFIKKDFRQTLSWLSLVNESNYEQSKRSAGIEVFGYFGADYSSFDENRRKLFSEQRYNLSTSDSREAFKASLTDNQVAAWAECMGKQTQLFFFYRDVTPISATVVVRWTAPAAVGPIIVETLDLPDGASTPIQPGQSFSGERAFIIRRESANRELRGLMNGIAGLDGASYQASFLVPKWEEKQNAEIVRPIRYAVPLRDYALRSRGFWDGGRQHTPFNCADAVPTGMERIELQVETRNTGKSRTCGVPSPYCDSAGEFCEVDILVRGCYVNRVWLDYYRELARRESLPFSNESVCGS